MVQAAIEEAKDVVRLLDPLIPRDVLPLDDYAVKALESPLRRVQHLCRDWGWDAESPENDDILSTVGDVIGEGTFGRVLVLGAGACRLADDLHRRFGVTEHGCPRCRPPASAAAHEVVRGGTCVAHQSLPFR